MKRFVSILAALLSLVLLTAPLTVAAEPIDMVTLQLSDPMVSMSGATMIDLSGLTFQLSGGSTADGSLTQLILDVVGNGLTAGSALLQVDDNGVVGYIGGMQNAYGIPMELIAQAVESATVNSNMDEINAFMQMVDEWALPEQMGELLSNYMEQNMVLGEATTKDVQLTTGTVSADYYPFTMNANGLVRDMFALFDNDPLMQAYLEMLKTEGDVHVNTYSELIPFDETDWQVTGGIANGDNFIVVDEVLALTFDEETVDFNLNVQMEDIATGGTNLQFSLVMAPEDESMAGQSIYLTFNCNVSGDTLMADGHFGYDFGYGDTYDLALTCTNINNNFTAQLTDSDGSVNVVLTANASGFEFTMTADGESVSLYGQKAGNGGFVGGIAVSDGTRIEITYTPTEEAGTLMSGNIALSFADSEDTYTFSCAVRALSTSVDSANTYVSPDKVIDITTLTEDDLSAIEEEITNVGTSILMRLAENVPFLKALLSE